MFGLFNKTKNENGKYTRQYYSFRSVLADRVLDIAQDGPFKGHGIIWDGYAGDNQSFTIIQEGPYWLIKCKQGENSYLTVESDANGAKLYLSPKSNDQRQRFRIDEHKDSKDHFIYTFCGKVLDVAGQGKKNGTEVVQWDFNGGKNQQWNFCNPKEITSSSSEQD
jgi:endo-1,4-beta-xylanase